MQEVWPYEIWKGLFFCMLHLRISNNVNMFLEYFYIDMQHVHEMKTPLHPTFI